MGAKFYRLAPFFASGDRHFREGASSAFQGTSSVDREALPGSAYDATDTMLPLQKLPVSGNIVGTTTSDQNCRMTITAF